MSFFLLLLCRDFVKFLSWIRKPESLILDKITGKSHLGWENRKVLSWIRKPESLILDKKTGESYLGYKNRKVLSCMRESKSLLLNFYQMSVEYLLNYCQMSAECLPNVPCLSNVPKFCPMLFAVKSWIYSDIFHAWSAMDIYL